MTQSGLKVPNFILNLETILLRKDLHPVVRWDQSGKCLCIVSIHKFQELVLPLYFRHSKFASFVRQLNIYGFKKCKSESTKGALFQHQDFSIHNINYKSFSRKKTLKKKMAKQLPEDIHSSTILDSLSPFCQNTLTNIGDHSAQEKEEENLDQPTISQLIQQIETRRNSIEIEDFMGNDLERIVNEPKYARARAYYVSLWNSTNSEQIQYERNGG